MNNAIFLDFRAQKKMILNQSIIVYNFAILDWNNFSDHASVYFSFIKRSSRKIDNQSNKYE